MTDLFLSILNMSITGAYVILTVMLARLALRRAPRRFSYLLWAIPAFRLVCPVSIPSPFSLFSLPIFDMSRAQAASPARLTYVPADIGMMALPEVTVGIPAANSIISGSLPAATPHYSANPMQVWTFIGAVIWVAGLAALLTWAIVSVLILRHRLRRATRREGNVWECERVASPFILGLFRPRIYVPYGLRDAELAHVLAHERVHLRRFDHIARPLSFLIAAVHWFDPLVWVAYVLMGRDMEMSCDERVLMHGTAGTDYSETLLRCAAPRHLRLSPLAFGETGVKARIRNILRWKKPELWVMIAAVALCAAVIAAACVNPMQREPSLRTLNVTPPGYDCGEGLTGEYVSWDCVYMTPFSSYMALGGDSGAIYTITDDALRIRHREAGITGGRLSVDFQEYQKKTADFEAFPFTKDEWEALYAMPGFGGPVNIHDTFDTLGWMELEGNYALMRLEKGGESQLWLLRLMESDRMGKFIWDIYSLVPRESMGSALWRFEPYSSSKSPTFNFHFGGINGLTDFSAVAADQEMTRDGLTLRWSPLSRREHVVMETTGEIHFSFQMDGVQYGGTIYIEDVQNGTAFDYTATIVGTGLQLSQDADGEGVVEVMG